MCSVTVGGPPELYSEEGLYGPIEDILFPIHRGIFGFVGFTLRIDFHVECSFGLGHVGSFLGGAGIG